MSEPVNPSEPPGWTREPRDPPKFVDQWPTDPLSALYCNHILGFWMSCTVWLEHGYTITGDYYTDLVAQVRTALEEKRQGMLSREVCCFIKITHTCTHVISSTGSHKKNSRFELLSQHRIRQILALSGEWLLLWFHKMKEFLRGRKV